MLAECSPTRASSHPHRLVSDRSPSTGLLSHRCPGDQVLAVRSPIHTATTDRRTQGLSVTHSELRIIGSGTGYSTSVRISWTACGLLVGALVASVAATSSYALAPALDGGAVALRPAERLETGPLGSTVGSGDLLDCSWDLDAVLASDPSGLEIADGPNLTAVYSGYSERPGATRQAVLLYVEDSQIKWCNDDLAVSQNEPTHTKGIAWNSSSRLFVALEVRSEVSGDVVEAAESGWLNSFSDQGGGSSPGRALVVATIDVSSGEPVAATFITAPPSASESSPNTVLVTIGFEGAEYRVETVSNSPPRRTDQSVFECDPAVSPYQTTYIFRSDFLAPTYVEAIGCT